jgi:flagellar basal body-associated protein FliL
MKDKKTVLIIVLSVLVVLLVGYIGYAAFQAARLNDQQLVYNQGLSDGRLLEQRDIITGILSSGFYAVPVVDENNQSQSVALGIIPPEQFAPQTAPVSSGTSVRG